MAKLLTRFIKRISNKKSVKKQRGTNWIILTGEYSLHSIKQQGQGFQILLLFIYRELRIYSLWNFYLKSLSSQNHFQRGKKSKTFWFCFRQSGWDFVIKKFPLTNW